MKKTLLLFCLLSTTAAFAQYGPSIGSHGFYAVIAIAMALGLGLDYAGLNAVKMLFWSAVLNGALAPPLLIIVVLLTSRADVMGEHRNGPLLRWLGWTCAVVMLIATVIMLVTAGAG